MPSVTHLSRNDLFTRIWERPATKVAAELGISDVGLLKVCERYNIPKPPRGYWAKVERGKPFERPLLPPVATPELERITMGQEGSICTAPSLKSEEYPALLVPNRLSSPHPLVANALVLLESRDRDSEGLAWAGGRTAVKVAVTRKNVGRAVRVMDTFVKALENNGFVLQPRGTYEHADVVLRRGGWDYPLKLREHLQRTVLPPTPKQLEELKKWGHYYGDKYKYTPDGRLVLTFGEDYAPMICQDTVNTRLEDKLGRFVGRILQRMAAEDERARKRSAEAAARERVLAEQRRKEEEDARLRQEEADRISNLKDQIARWRLGRDIRDYLREMQELIASHQAVPTEGGPLERWMKWAQDYTQAIDPLNPLKGELEKMQKAQTHEQENRK